MSRDAYISITTFLLTFVEFTKCQCQRVRLSHDGLTMQRIISRKSLDHCATFVAAFLGDHLDDPPFAKDFSRAAFKLESKQIGVQV